MKIAFAKISADKIANIYLTGEIGWEANANVIADEINYISNNKIANKIKLHINSEGGSVIDGIRIVSAVLNSQIPVETINEGYAMSMAAVIWLAAKRDNRFMSDFAVTMLHAPYFPGEDIEDFSEDLKDFLTKTYNQLSTILQMQTGKSKEDIDMIFSRDSFYDAQDCINAGFCSKENIISYGEKPLIDNSLPIDLKIKKIAAFYNNLKKIDMNVLDKLNNMLGLRTEASETVTIEAINALKSDKTGLEKEIVSLKKDYQHSQTSLKDAENKVKELEAKLTEFETKEVEAKEAAAEKLVKDAIAAGKFNSEKEADLIALAKKDIDSFNLLCESVNVKAPNIAAELNNDTPENGYGVEEKDFDFETLEAKYPDVLAKIQVENPKMYNTLLGDYAKKYNIKLEEEK